MLRVKDERGSDLFRLDPNFGVQEPGSFLSILLEVLIR